MTTPTLLSSKASAPPALPELSENTFHFFVFLLFLPKINQVKKIYHLSTCSTCKRILNELNPGRDVELQDIKEEPISPEQIDEMAHLAGSYEPLFSRRARKYKSMGLKDKELTERDYRQLILDEYTFLKRPVMIFDDQIFIGNSAKSVEEAKKILER